MSRSLIADSPALVWGAGELITVKLDPLTLPTGRVIGDYSSFRIAVREDPFWPRTGSEIAAALAADPNGDGWALAASATGALDGDDVPVFTFTMPEGAGYRRYAVDVWAAVSGGEVQLVRPIWVTCGARVVAPA